MGYRLNRLDEPVFMAVPKPMLTEFGIHYILESCGIHCKTCLREKRVELNKNKKLADKGWLVVIPINTASPDGMGWGCGRRSGCGSRGGATESPHEIRPLLTNVRSS